MKDILQNKTKAFFSKELPADTVDLAISRQVVEACFSFVVSKEPKAPMLIHTSSKFLKELDVTIEDVEEFTKVMSGAKPFNDFKAYAMCYGGHQFGNWAGQLGDGRAINIAELDLNGDNWKVQLKGAGPTPYSRGSDGLAVLRSSIREYLCSEAMHNLGIPTTRALSLVKSGDMVPRDMLYDGNQKEEHGAIVCRMSSSFIRFGSFEIFTSRQDHKNLKTLVDYTIKHHYSKLGSPSKETYIKFFKEVVRKTREMIVHWQRVGFVHGVMNTDNMSILGQTIDYGPYGWLEDYNPNWTPNTTDASNKRYRFGNQASVALWNLTQLANAIYPLIEEVEPLQRVLDDFKVAYQIDYKNMMCKKLGINKTEAISDGFIDELEKNLTRSEIDYTLFFRKLSENVKLEENSFWDILKKSSYLNSTQIEIHKDEWTKWFDSFLTIMEEESFDFEERSRKMKAVNPKYVLRNYMAQLAIEDAEKGNYELIDELYQLLLKPYDEQPEMEKWFVKRPDWAKHKVGCSMLSCSS